METRLTLRPGQRGTKKLMERSGKRLLCVRYLYDDERGVRLKTVELVVEEVLWSVRARKPRRRDHDLFAVRVDWEETDLRAAVKRAGGIWRPRQRLWELS